MKLAIISLAVSAAFVSCGASATDSYDHRQIPFYQAQYNMGQSEVNAGQSAVNKAQSGVNNDLYGKISSNKSNQDKINAGQSSVNAGQASVNKSQSGVNESLSGRIDQNKGYQEQVNKGQSQVNAAQGGVNTDIYSKLGTTSTTLNEYGTRLDSYGSDVTNIRNDFGSAMANIDGRLGDAQATSHKALRKADKAQEASAIGMAVAGHQFNTEPEAGLQVALSAASTGDKQGVALGMGGAINEKWFVNAGFGSSGSTTAGVVSTTYSFGR
jgi:hypothetical protein